MNFYEESITPVNVKNSPFKLKTSSKSFFIGSCFSTNLFNKFESLHLNVENSPFGNIYNPLSIAQSLGRLLENRQVTTDECFIVDGLYQHFDFHSTYGLTDKKEYTEFLNNSIDEARTNLLSSDLLIITLGTAFIYEQNNKVVNNCHKLHKDQFLRRALTTDEITNALVPILKEIKSINNKIEIVLTLSPVRHLRDDPTENSYSKALLRVAIEQIASQLAIFYFPSYEILLDELRDYRWYDKSLNHPNHRTIEYIISKFINSTADNELKEYIKRAEKLNQLINHKIININSDSTKKFLIKREKTVNQMQKDYTLLPRLQRIKSYQYL